MTAVNTNAGMNGSFPPSGGGDPPFDGNRIDQTIFPSLFRSYFDLVSDDGNTNVEAVIRLSDFRRYRGRVKPKVLQILNDCDN